jgi:hypothetical protein
MTRRSLVAVCLLVLTAAVSCRTQAAEPVPDEGDLVFETSGSSQAAAVEWATGSRWTHVGIVERTGKDLAVIEALGKVSRTPWKAWARRAHRGGDYLVLRPRGLTPAQRQAAVAEARRLLGKPYDARFGWGDDRIYCSELVVKAYQRGAGVAYGRRQRVGDLRLLGLEGAIERRWGKVPYDLVLVTPASLAEDARLARVR